MKKKYKVFICEKCAKFDKDGELVMPYKCICKKSKKLLNIDELEQKRRNQEIIIKKWRTNRRQGFVTSINELRRIADELEQELENDITKNGLQMQPKAIGKQEWQLNIINKKGYSDTWKFER